MGNADLSDGKKPKILLQVVYWLTNDQQNVRDIAKLQIRGGIGDNSKSIIFFIAH